LERRGSGEWKEKGRESEEFELQPSWCMELLRRRAEKVHQSKRDQEEGWGAYRGRGNNTKKEVNLDCRRYNKVRGVFVTSGHKNEGSQGVAGMQGEKRKKGDRGKNRKKGRRGEWKRRPTRSSFRYQ